MLVNSEQARMLVLLNDGNCTLYYRLFLEQCSPEAVGNGPLGTQTWAGLGWEAGNEGRWLRLVNQTMAREQAEQGLKRGASTS